MEKDTIIPVKFFRKLTMKEIEAFTDLLISFEKENNVEVTTISISAVQRRARAKTTDELSNCIKPVVNHPVCHLCRDTGWYFIPNFAGGGQTVRCGCGK